MPRKIALKRLSHSDLKLFKVYFDRDPSGRQKGINLNANVLINKFYPGLPPKVENVHLVLSGPGITSIPDRQVREIDRSEKSKNRRLQAAFIHNPPGTYRYTPLAINDLALMEFFDNPASLPESIVMTLISQTLTEDNAAYSALTGLVPLSRKGTKTMIALTPSDLESMLAGILPPAHSLRSFLTDESELELLAEGADVNPGELEQEFVIATTVASDGATGTSKARTYIPIDFNKTSRPSLSRVSHEAMARARETAILNGEKGEALVNRHLTDNMASAGFEWSSRDNARAPYDFLLRPAGKQTMVDVKSTSKDFDIPFHLSINEVRQAASALDEYRIYRVYDLNGLPKLRISDDIRVFATGLMLLIKAMPPGVIADGFTLKPSLLAAEICFGPEISLH